MLANVRMTAMGRLWPEWVESGPFPDGARPPINCRPPADFRPRDHHLLSPRRVAPQIYLSKIDKCIIVIRYYAESEKSDAKKPLIRPANRICDSAS